MLRALQRFLGTGIPVIGVNFGRVGFLSAIPRDELERGVARVLAGELEVVELSTLDVEVGGERFVAVNDAVVTSGELGRMVELEWSVGGEDFGRVPCDGLICSTPSGSTAYNLSNGGPVLMWGLDAMALTFVAPHDLRARPFVLPRGHDLHVWNRTADVGCAVLVDGHRLAEAGPGGRVSIRLGERALAAGHAARGDVRAPLPTELRQPAPLGASSARPAPSARATCESRPAGLPSPAMLRRLRIENLVLIREAELELGEGLNVLSGETGAGKTIFAQAIGLLLGVKGDAAAVGQAASEAYVEAEFEVPAAFWDEVELEALAALRPEDEPTLILARRVFADGRTRAYAWGRAIAREDLAGATERLLAMSGQFEQRRLARPAYQLDALDAFAGAPQALGRSETRSAWRALTAARRRSDETTRDAGAESARLAALRELVERTEGIERGEEDSLRAERERMRHAAELAEGAAAAAAAVAPEEGEGAAS